MGGAGEMYRMPNCVFLVSLWNKLETVTSGCNSSQTLIESKKCMLYCWKALCSIVPSICHGDGGG